MPPQQQQTLSKEINGLDTGHLSFYYYTALALSLQWGSFNVIMKEPRPFDDDDDSIFLIIMKCLLSS